MRASEYLERATVYIADNEKALEVRRELEAHIRESAGEVEEMGIDRETAELVAVARMGPPEKVALELAETHHRHLPWRHYLAVIPLLVQVCGSLIVPYWSKDLATFWWIIFFLCLIPQRSTLVRWATYFRLDLLAKVRQVNRHPKRVPILIGLAAGGLAGMLEVIVVGGGAVLSFDGALLAFLILPQVVSGGVLLALRSRAKALHSAVTTVATFAPITFVAMLAGVHHPDEALFVCGLNALATFVVAAVIDRLYAVWEAART